FAKSIRQSERVRQSSSAESPADFGGSDPGGGRLGFFWTAGGADRPPLGVGPDRLPDRRRRDPAVGARRLTFRRTRSESDDVGTGNRSVRPAVATVAVLHPRGDGAAGVEAVRWADLRAKCSSLIGCRATPLILVLVEIQSATEVTEHTETPYPQSPLCGL